MISSIPNMNMNAVDDIYEVRAAVSWILCGVSLLTSTTISVDRLSLGQRYRHVKTLSRRAPIFTICFWLICALGGLIRVWRRDIVFTGVFVVITFSVMSSIFSYTRIHFELRNHHAQVQDSTPQRQPKRGGNPLNISQYKKIVSSTM